MAEEPFWTAVMSFLQHPLVTFFSLVLAVVGIGLTIRSRRLRRPRWAVRSNNLITGFSPGLSALEVKYADRKIENLTISKILFWNAGAETINRSDVAEADPLRVTAVGSVTLLDFRLLKTNNAANRFAVVGLPSGEAGLEFDFLDKGEGALVQVVHTGRSSSDLAVRGTVKGAGAVRKRDITTYRSRLHRWLDVTPNSLIIGIGGAVAAVSGYKSSNVRLFVAGVAGLSVFVGYIAFRYWEGYMPRGLEDYARD